MTELMATQGRQSNQDRTREAQFIMLFKVVHGLVAVPPEGHIEKAKTRTTATTSLKLVLYVPNHRDVQEFFLSKKQSKIGTSCLNKQ